MAPESSSPPVPPDPAASEEAHAPPAPAVKPDDEDEARTAAGAAEFAAALEAYESTQAVPLAPGPRPARKQSPAPRVGQRVSCRIVAVSGDSLLLDIGGRSEAVADASEFRAEDGTLTVAEGQMVELFVVEAGEQVVLAKAARRNKTGKPGRSLEGVRQARTADLPVRGRVTAVNTGGLTVDVDGVRAFCPLSQIDVARVEDPAPFVGRVLEFLVSEVDESRHRVVVSRRRLLQREQAERARERLAALAPGQELEGTVTRLEPFGVFVDLGGFEGMAHVSELSHARVNHPREVVAQGDKLRVKVLRVETGKDGRPRVALSVRAAAPDPWTTAVERFVPGTRVPGVVVRLAEFGAFVNIAPGVDGLVHVSQVSERRIQHVREVLSPGQAVEAIVLAVEPERRRISLSLKDPAASAMQTEAPAEAPARIRRARDGDRPAARGNRPPGRGAPGARERRPSSRAAEAESYRPAPPPVDDSPTTMQLAFRRAREAAERRKAR
jgi:small subunit ribosomal protein S1